MNQIAQYFNNRAYDWEKNFNNPSPVQGAVAAIAGVHAGCRVLDLGCGTGIMAPIYLGLDAGRVVALDMAPRMIEIAQEKFADRPSLEFCCSDVYEFQTDERFDAVVIYNAYPHFLDKEALAEKVASLLVPGGRFVVAHSMSCAQMNVHHATVPTYVTTSLRPATVEASAWERFFDVDSVVDSPGFYCFGGSLREA